MNAVHVLPQFPSTRHVETRFDANANNTLWLTLPKSIDGSAPYFSPALLEDLMSVLGQMKEHGVSWPWNGFLKPIHYTVMKSAHPDFFSLGGDLAYFHDCINRRDSEALRNYSLGCADMIHDWSSMLGTEATSIALVQGRALGGGFEAALAADLIVAEEHAEFGFPEILFGLFPCTGGMSLLAQRIGARAAERMLGDGRIYSAAALKKLGVIDEVCPKGQGEQFVEKLISTHARQRMARLMLQRSRHRIASLDRTELHAIVDEWTETAMNLSTQQLRVMEALFMMQRGRAGVS
ncbi:MAG TPA: crotonase/enoyl-CoA hydratase family protein [Dokdonella sp.]|uniref:crotonase/enoyl-CoA hydratase family protein n=1 Tax=Dokdonella sp. TaxID=2291710 RepID=UPI002D80AD5D|nr:crotonase/enoyl-CoA hydratase family protein [Dokdonella sp.]HET9032759.1 crotonase/enoyl-CoA hydratase family protein [Dokdonella sp.]